MTPDYDELKLLVQQTTKNNIGLIMKLGEYIEGMQSEITELKKKVRVLEEKETMR